MAYDKIQDVGLVELKFALSGCFQFTMFTIMHFVDV